MRFRSRRYDEFGEEVRSHIDSETDRLIREGMTPKDARAAALRVFGNVAAVRERFYESRRLNWLDQARRDAGYAIRILLRSPGFTAIAILSLALGIGANTAIFSLLDQIVFRKLPVVRPDELVVLKSPGPWPGRSTADEPGGPSWSYPMYKDLRDKSQVFAGMLARFKFAANVGFASQTIQTDGELVSGNYFSLLGVKAAIGRLFDASDDVTPGGHPLVVLRYGFWKRQFGSDPAILNRSIAVNGQQMTIVGVTQPEFLGVQLGFVPDVFVPIAMKAEMTPGWNGLDRHDDHWLNIIARLKPGVTLAQASASLSPLYRSLLVAEADQLHLGGDRRPGFLAKPIVLEDGSGGRQTLRRDAQQPLFVLMAMVGLVLLVACINLTNLLMARAAARQREIAVRLAIGASRRRLVRQLLVESALLGTLGGGAALTVAYWTLNGLPRTMPRDSGTTGLSGSLDPRILLFNFGLSLVSGFAFGIFPSLRATRTGLSSVLKQEGGSISAGHMRLRKMLVIGQVAFTVLMMAGAGLFTKTLLKLRTADIGMRADHVIQFDLSPYLNGYTPVQSRALYRNLREEIGHLPGVDAATMAAVPVLRNSEDSRNVTIEGYESASPGGLDFYRNSIGPGYFSTMGIPLENGREFNESDETDSPKVCIINETAAEHYFRGRNPIGYKIAFGSGNRAVPDMEIVGVVKNSKHATVDETFKDFIYVPYTQFPELNRMTFYVRAQIEPSALMPSLRRAVQLTDSSLPIVGLKTLEKQIDESVFVERILTTLLAAFGMLAIVLATLGIYGVMSYVVARRTREIGIRIALGALPSEVRFLVLNEVLSMVGIGIALGIPLALGFGKIVQSMLHGTAPYDLTVLGITAAGVILLSAVAGYLPARRAMRINPMTALRYE